MNVWIKSLVGVLITEKIFQGAFKLCPLIICDAIVSGWYF